MRSKMKELKRICEAENLDYKKIIDALDNAIESGFRRSGSWEREWLEQVLGPIDDFKRYYKKDKNEY